MFDALKTKNACVEWIRGFFEENGKGCNAVVGISGGKDSSIVAALCVEALGKERVIGVLMPCGVQHDIDCAYAVVNHLGIRHYVVNIQDDAVEHTFTGDVFFHDGFIVESTHFISSCVFFAAENIRPAKPEFLPISTSQNREFVV